MLINEKFCGVIYLSNPRCDGGLLYEAYPHGDELYRRDDIQCGGVCVMNRGGDTLHQTSFYRVY